MREEMCRLPAGVQSAWGTRWSPAHARGYGNTALCEGWEPESFRQRTVGAEAAGPVPHTPVFRRRALQS